MRKISSLFILSLICSTSYGNAIKSEKLLQLDGPTLRARLQAKVVKYTEAKDLCKRLAPLYEDKAMALGIYGTLNDKQRKFADITFCEAYAPLANSIWELKGLPQKTAFGLIKDTEKETTIHVRSKSEKVTKKAEAFKNAHKALTLHLDLLEGLLRSMDEELHEGIDLRRGALDASHAAYKIAKEAGHFGFDQKGQYVKKSVKRQETGSSASSIFHFGAASNSSQGFQFSRSSSSSQPITPPVFTFGSSASSSILQQALRFEVPSQTFRFEFLSQTSTLGGQSSGSPAGSSSSQQAQTPPVFQFASVPFALGQPTTQQAFTAWSHKEKIGKKAVRGKRG